MPMAWKATKPIAREIFDHCGLPTDVIVPTARGDLLWGVLLGWQALHRQGLIPRLPRMHAVEPYARLSRALQTGDARALGSGHGPILHRRRHHHAAIAAGAGSLRRTARGGVRCRRGPGAAAAGTDGLATELSSAAALAAVTRLRRSGMLDAESSVVLILTSDGRRG